MISTDILAGLGVTCERSVNERLSRLSQPVSMSVEDFLKRVQWGVVNARWGLKEEERGSQAYILSSLFSDLDAEHVLGLLPL